MANVIESSWIESPINAERQISKICSAHSSIPNCCTMSKLSGKFEQCACLLLYLCDKRVHSIFKTEIQWSCIHMQMGG